MARRLFPQQEQGESICERLRSTRPCEGGPSCAWEGRQPRRPRPRRLLHLRRTLQRGLAQASASGDVRAYAWVEVRHQRSPRASSGNDEECGGVRKRAAGVEGYATYLGGPAAASLWWCLRGRACTSRRASGGGCSLSSEGLLVLAARGATPLAFGSICSRS